LAGTIGSEFGRFNHDFDFERKHGIDAPAPPGGEIPGVGKTGKKGGRKMGGEISFQREIKMGLEINLRENIFRRGNKNGKKMGRINLGNLGIEIKLKGKTLMPLNLGNLGIEIKLNGNIFMPLNLGNLGIEIKLNGNIFMP